VTLESLTCGISQCEGSWGNCVGLWSIGIGECSIQGNLKDILVGDGWTSQVLRVVEGDTSEVWDSDSCSILDKVWVDGASHEILDSRLDGTDNGWDKRALNKWYQDTGDLSNSSSGKFNVNIIWVDVDIELLDVKLWCLFTIVDRVLLGEFNLGINSEVLDVNDGSSAHLQEKVLESEVRGHVCSHTRGFEFSRVR